MPEPDDELERLRAADPASNAPRPSATDPDALELFERITMTDHARRPRRPALLLAAAAAVVVLLVGLAFALNRDDGDDARSDVAAGSSTTTTAIAGGPITPGGGAASCVERYDLTTLTHRETAFDGTVQAVDGDTVTFTVNHWYRGGEGDRVSLAGAAVLSGVTSAGPGASLEPGTRLLVSGDGGFAWSCGFTQAYAESVAAQWQQALGG